MNQAALARPVPGEDKRMIDEPQWWPAWPLLPVKRPVQVDGGYQTECGVVRDKRAAFNDEPWPGTITVRLSLLGLPVTKETPTQEYESVDAMLNDGWVVD